MEQNFEFVNSWVLFLLSMVPLLLAFLLWRGNKLLPYMKVSSTDSLDTNNSFIVKTRHIPLALRCLALILLILALARPRAVEVSSEIMEGLGIDIVIATDISSSMLARDFKPNRLEALRVVAKNFIEGRKGDRIALVSYATESYTQTPLTTDKRVLIDAIENMEQGTLGGSTAIGMGLGSAINRLKESQAKSKVIILMTDGVNNDGFVDPLTAAEAAKKLGLKVYTIGIGTNGLAEAPYALHPITGDLIYKKMPVEIDEALLRKIAKETGGKYFRATDEETLASIYKEIDKLEKSKVEQIQYYSYKEYYKILIIIAFGLLALEFLLRRTLYRSFIS